LWDWESVGDDPLRVLVLGGYGLIGLAASKRLICDNHTVTGLGRSANKGKAFLRTAEWLEADISKLTQHQDWLPYLVDIDAVVNASGALQNGLKDNVAAVQVEAITALIEACEKTAIQVFVQISAPGADENADTQFYRTKGKADSVLMASSLQWTILRPGLVIAPHAYGGTSLIRILAAFPIIQPIIMADTPIQTVSIDDVAEAVSLAVNGDLPCEDIDLVEAHSRRLAELVTGVRAWLGFAKPKMVLEIPYWVGQASAKLADLAGWLGWRSALRTTSLAVLTKGVTGDPALWERLSGRQARTFEQTLDIMPATMQERIYARAMLAFPIVLVVLSGFWITSGVVGLMQHARALAVVEGGLPEPIAHLFVRGGSIIDILVGAALLFRPTVRLACFASIIVSAGYLIGSVVFVPELWTDPLGPMVKVLPAIGLALIVAALSEER
jgi:uncharacterized protein YbjT (DUF2867 family)